MTPVLKKCNTLGKCTIIESIYDHFIVLHYCTALPITVHDCKLSHFFSKKTAKKCHNLGTFNQKILFLDYNKTKKAKSVTIWSMSI